MRTLAALLLAAASLTVGTAVAAGSHDFTLRQAHQAAVARMLNGPPMRWHVGRCYWKRSRVAACPTVVPMGDGYALVSTGVVTRWGACPLAATGRGIASGSDAGWHGCYTGRPVALFSSPVLVTARQAATFMRR